MLVHATRNHQDGTPSGTPVTRGMKAPTFLLVDLIKISAFLEILIVVDICAPRQRVSVHDDTPIIHYSE